MTGYVLPDKPGSREGKMKPSNLVIQADQLLKAVDFEYAIGGGQAIDLFLGCKSRVHSDMDIVAFRYDGDRIIQFMWLREFLSRNQARTKKSNSFFGRHTVPLS